MEEWNEYLYTYVQELPSSPGAKLHIANSIWFREDGLQVERDFLQKNADYYSASVYKAPFDEGTAKDINRWVEKHTDGMIGELVEDISRDTMMYLINALAFDGAWETPFSKNDVRLAQFHSEGPGALPYMVDMMYGEAGLYIDDGSTTGFIKPYQEGAYSFAALLPRQGETVDQFLSSLTGEGLLNLIANAREEQVQIALPKFQCAYDTSLKDVLIDMGMSSAFAEADFSGIGRSADGPLYIFDVLQKTYISVDEAGTKAAAAAAVEMRDEAAIIGPTVVLDRPFVYLILDGTANLPLFIGVVNNLSME